MTRPPREQRPRVPTAAHFWALGWVTVTFVVLSIVFSQTAEAQWSRPSGWHRLSIGAGPARAWTTGLPARRDGVSAMAAFELVAREHVELRFSGTLFEGDGREETQLGGVALDAIVFPWRGRVQPYVGLGAGAYQLILEDRDSATVDPRPDYKGLAWTALVGTRVRVGALTPFVEWRRTAFGGDAPVARYAPLVAGLHF